MFRRTTENEKRLFYKQGFSKIRKYTSKSILKTIKNRDFVIFNNGSVPKKATFKNYFKLTKFLKKTCPDSVYYSTGQYKYPYRRGEWLEAELAFDIDAKNYNKQCCNGKVNGTDICPVCLERARLATINCYEVLKDELGLKNIQARYSGKGFHLDSTDKDLVTEGKAVRESIFDYVKDATNARLDAVVTVDIHRILRFPPSLNIDVSAICSIIDLYNFNVEDYIWTRNR